MANLFLLSSRYLVPLETIEPHRDEHLQWMRDQVKAGKVLFGGPRVPRDGAYVIVNVASKEVARELFEHDPYFVRNFVRYDVTEFKIVVAGDAFKEFLA